VGLSLFSFLSSSFDDLSQYWTVIVLFCNLATIFVLFFLCRTKEITFGKFINYEKGKTNWKTAMMVTLVMLAIGVGGMQLAGLISYGEIPHFPLMLIQPIPLWIAIINVFALPLTTTIAEDGIYLGVINQSNSKATVVLSAFFYALQHSFIPLMPDTSFAIYRFLSFLPVAIVMCFWYKKNRNPLPFMIGHFVLNLATVTQIVMTSISPELYEQMMYL